MLFDTQNFATCAVTGQWTYEGGSKTPFILRDVQRVEVHHPEGRKEQIQQGYPMNFLNSCTEFSLGKFHVKDGLITLKKRKYYCLYVGELIDVELDNALTTLSTESKVFMLNALKKNGGIIAYWDSQAIAIICKERYQAEKVLSCMERMAICYNPVHGLELCRVV